MKYTLIIIAVFLSSLQMAFAQKRPINFEDIDKWPFISNEKISNDGNFVLYTVGSKVTHPKVFIKGTETDGRLSLEINNARNADFTEDSKYAVFINSADSLGIIDLITGNKKIIRNVSSYQKSKKGNAQWLVYQTKNTPKNVVALNLFSGKTKLFENIDGYQLSENGKVLLLHKRSESSTQDKESIIWYDLNLKTQKVIWKGNNAQSLTFDTSATRLAFFAERTQNNKNQVQIMRYNTEADSAIIYVSPTGSGILPGFEVSNKGDLKFSSNGDKLFFPVSKMVIKSMPDRSVITPDVNVWSYKDREIQSVQRHVVKYNEGRLFEAVITDESHKIIQIDKDYDDGYPKIEASSGKYALMLCHYAQENDDWYWQPFSVLPDLCLVSTETGNKTVLKKSFINYGSYNFSTTGNYAIWYDAKERNYYCYNIATGIKKNISKNFPVSLTDEKFSRFTEFGQDYGVEGWINSDESVIIADRYDLWQVDPEGVRMPINITGGYGRKSRIILRCVGIEDYVANYIKPLDNELLLSGLDEIKKLNGFYKLKIGRTPSLRRLTNLPEAVYIPQPFPSSYTTLGSLPIGVIKAKYANSYLVTRMSATKAPNLYFTHDLKQFTAISNIQPAEKFNWLTAQLVNWTLPDGKLGQGILYKPENFDPKKKYPLIFFFYENNSDCINIFLKPELVNSDINIPWFVSHGYLIFVPDIHHTVATKGSGTDVVRSVISAEKHLSRLPFIDIKRLGVQGHSLGGYEVDYLVTQTQLFSAAVAGAGVSDPISLFGGLRSSPLESSGAGFAVYYLRLGTTPYQERSRYIKETPIFHADKVTTPLLLMHNRLDGSINFNQGIEFFTALRRTGKKVWLLEYDDEGHSIQKPQNQKDYTIRLQQFFDHYLKGASAPTWMTKGIPAKEKGIISGLELDPGHTP